MDCIENLVKFGHVVFMIEQTEDQNTDTLFSVLCTPPWRNVITDESLFIAMMQYFVSTRCQYYELCVVLLGQYFYVVIRVIVSDVDVFYY